MRTITIPHRDITEISKFMQTPDGLLKVKNSSRIRAFDQATISTFCHANGYYGLPTWELVEWLQERIRDRQAIEVAAGHGALAMGLGIRATDSFLQEQEWFKQEMVLNAFGPPTVRYGSNVEKMEASEAVRHYRPEVVVAMWGTQRWRHGYRSGLSGPNAGIDYLDLVSRCQEVFLVGHQWVHGKMEMVKKTCVAEVRLDFLVSRSMATAINRVYILRRK